MPIQSRILLHKCSSRRLDTSTCRLVASTSHLVASTCHFVVSACHLVVSTRRPVVSSSQLVVLTHHLFDSASRLVNVVSSFQLVVSSCQIIVSSCQQVISSSRHGTSRHFNSREDFKTEKRNWTSSSTHVGAHSGSVNSATQRPQIKNTNCFLLRTIQVLFIYSYIYLFICLFYNRHFGYYQAGLQITKS